MVKQKKKVEVACVRCSSVHDCSQMEIFNEEYVCQDCFQAHTVVCDCCNTRIWAEDNEGDYSVTLCTYCRDNYYMIRSPA